MSEVIFLLGEGGAVWEMTLPLERNIAERFETGQLVRVNADGSEWTGERPPKRSRRTAGLKNETEAAFGD